MTTRRLAALARRTGQRYAVRDLQVNLVGAGRQLSIALPADPDAPLDRFAADMNGARVTGAAHSANASSAAVVPARTAASSGGDVSRVALAADEARRAVADGAHMPYWGLLWPSGLALAEALFAVPEALPGTRALELGCGLGVTAAATLALGARLTAVDCFAEALLFTRYNVLRNSGHEPRTLLADWRGSAGRAACRQTGPFDVLLAADVLYEQEDVAPLLALAPQLLTSGGTFWLAEPGRRVARLFVAEATARGWHDEESMYDRAWPPDSEVTRVTVHRLTDIR